jgi:hypothetical protein
MERGLRIRSVSLAPWTFHHTDDSPAKRARELEQVYLSQAPSEMARRDRAMHPVVPRLHDATWLRQREG